MECHCNMYESISWGYESTRHNGNIFAFIIKMAWCHFNNRWISIIGLFLNHLKINIYRILRGIEWVPDAGDLILTHLEIQFLSYNQFVDQNAPTSIHFHSLEITLSVTLHRCLVTNKDSWVIHPSSSWLCNQTFSNPHFSAFSQQMSLAFLWLCMDATSWYDGLHH